jgi:PilZ domain
MSAVQSAAVASIGETPLERRERRAVSLRAFAVREDGSSVEVLLLDLSYEGCGVESPVPLKLGEALRLAVLKRGVIKARVRWCRGNKAGLVFESEEGAPEDQQPRGAERKELGAEVSMRRLGKINYRVHIFDVSPDGCKVELVDRPRLGEHVLIKFDGLESLEAEVCWIDGTSAGLRFERPIHDAVFSLLLERLS